MNLTGALADETRVRTLLALRQGELCVCQITELFGLAPSTISKHLSILAQAGLVESRKEGRWIYYKLPGKDASAAVREAIDWVEKALDRNPRVAEDNRKLNKVLKQDPAVLCKRQTRSQVANTALSLATRLCYSGDAGSLTVRTACSGSASKCFLQVFEHK